MREALLWLAAVSFIGWNPTLALSSIDRSASKSQLSAPSTSFSRRQWMSSVAAAAVAVAVASGTPYASPAYSALTASSTRIDDEELKRVVTSDLLNNQFLVTGNLTRGIYLKEATFTDEIDTYGLEQWMKGTQKLFVGEGSQVRLVGDIRVSPDSVEFRFDEDLMFRIPFRPVVKLSGRLVLTRDKETGLISSYREYWDQDVGTVLRTAKF